MLYPKSFSFPIPEWEKELKLFHKIIGHYVLIPPIKNTHIFSSVYTLETLK